MYRIRRFGVIKTATIVAVMYLIITAVIFVPIALIGGIAAIAAGGNGGGAAVLGIVLFGLVAALFYGAVGWVVTAIACVLYNAAAGFVGGIELQLEAVAPPVPVPAWGPPSTSAQAAPPASPPAAPPPG